MQDKLRNLIYRGSFPIFPFLRKLLRGNFQLFPSSGLLNRPLACSPGEHVLPQGDYIQSHYENGVPLSGKKDLQNYRRDSLSPNGADHPIWSYIDLKESLYDKKGIDIFYDLESGKPLPLEDNKAEVIFSSFVIRPYFSFTATKNLCSGSFSVIEAIRSGIVFHYESPQSMPMNMALELWKRLRPDHTRPF